MALIVTFATTPLTAALYPPWYQRKLELWKRGEIDWDGTRLISDGGPDKDSVAVQKLESNPVKRLLVNLRLDSLPSLLTLLTLLNPEGPSDPPPKIHPLKAGPDDDEKLRSAKEKLAVRRSMLEVHGVRVLELTERTSSVMKVAEVDEYAVQDPVINIFRTFGKLNNVAVSGGVAVIPETSYADTITRRASDLSSDLVLIPWSETGSVTDGPNSILDSTENRFASHPHNQFISNALSKASCNTAILVNRGLGGQSRAVERSLRRTVSGLSIRSGPDLAVTIPITDRSHHIFFPFFGGIDDRIALRFVLQLAQNPNVTATIIYISISASALDADTKAAVSPTISHSKPFGSAEEGSSRASPRQARTNRDSEGDAILFSSLRDSLPSALSSRVVFEELSSPNPATEALSRAQLEVGKSPKNAGDIVVVGRDSWSSTDRNMALLAGECKAAIVQDRRRCLGDMAELMLATSVQASVLVIKAAGQSGEL